MALDANAQYVPLTFKTTTKSDGSLAVTGLQHALNVSADVSGSITSATIASAVVYSFGDAALGDSTDLKSGSYNVAVVDTDGRLTKGGLLTYDQTTGVLNASSFISHGGTSSLGNILTSGNIAVTGNAEVQGLLIGNNAVSALSGLSISGSTVASGTLSALSGLSVSSSISAVDNEGHALVVRRDDDASYENLIKAYDGTLTLQAEDDVHLKSNTGEDFARFNENAAVWLYHNDVKKLETAAEGVYTSGISRTTEGSMTSGTHSVNRNSSAIVVSDFRQPHGAGAFFWGELSGDGTSTASEVNFGTGAIVSGTSSVGRTGAANTNGYYGWNSATNKLDVSSTGVYRVQMNAAGVVNTNTDSVFKVYANGVNVYTRTLRVHTVTDPHLISLDWVGLVNAGGDAIHVTGKGNAEGVITLQFKDSSTLFVQRLS